MFVPLKTLVSNVCKFFHKVQYTVKPVQWNFFLSDIIQFLNHNLVLFQSFHFSPKIHVSFPLHYLRWWGVCACLLRSLIYYSNNWIVCAAALFYCIFLLLWFPVIFFNCTKWMKQQWRLKYKIACVVSFLENTNCAGWWLEWGKLTRGNLSNKNRKLKGHQEVCLIPLCHVTYPERLLPNHVTLGKFLNFYVPLFLHL